MNSIHHLFGAFFGGHSLLMYLPCGLLRSCSGPGTKVVMHMVAAYQCLPAASVTDMLCLPAGHIHSTTPWM